MEASCALVLEDGTVVRGLSFGARGRVFGELVFNTGMTGYQEALTDPSYNGQLLMMTYPLIGNYGISAAASESSSIKAEAFVVREACPRPSHREGRRTISEFLEEQGIMGVQGVDTRDLTMKTRVRGTMRAALTTEGDEEALLEKVRSLPFPDSSNLVGEVSTREPLRLPFEGKGRPLRVAVVDCGVKRSILENLQRFAEVTVVPYSWSAGRVMDEGPDGVLVSNGPGDPAHPEVLATTVRAVRELASRVPVMGICLGHQILALAFGGRTFKLKFGHRGANQPVREVGTHRVRMTSQNHGFAVHPDLPQELQLLETNVNDGTVEALRHRELPCFSVQYHPEASPGPRDARGMFGLFQDAIERSKGGI